MEASSAQSAAAAAAAAGAGEHGGAAAAAYASQGPAEHALDGLPNQTLTRRRTSLPSSGRTTSALSLDTYTKKKRSPNAIRTQAASPEVISSLIDQLSAISASTQSHFENLPTSPDLPASRSSRTSLAGHHGSSLPPSPYDSAIRDQNDLFPDDACEPPVVRTSKPPSGKSPITAPAPTSSSKPRKDKAHSLSGYVGRSGGSSASIHSCYSHRSSNSFGNISIEAGHLASKPVPAGGSGSNRSSVESKRSVKRPRSLMYMGSRERLKQKETDSRKRLEDAASPVSPRKPASQLFSYEDTIKEEPMTKEEHDPIVVAESSRFAPRYPSRNPSPARRIRLNLVDGPNGESPLEQGLIPDRASSLRHGSPKKSKKSSSSKSRDKGKEAERPKTIAGTLPDKPPTPRMDPEEVRKQELLLELEQEENEVAQRIKQLREQKLLREKLAKKLHADGPAAAGAAEVRPRVSGLSSPGDSSTPVVTSASEHRERDTMKARSFLGVSAPPLGRSSTESDLNKPLPSIVSLQPTRPAPLPPHLRHARHRSLTVNDGDDLSLPFNYALALQSLETSAPNSPRTPRVDSTQMTLPPPHAFSPTSTRTTSSSRDGIKRSSSLSMGGRSAFGRRTNSMVLNGSKGHKHTSSLDNDRPHALRSASEELSSGRHSSLSTASASNSFALQQQKTVKKKRWSHPDLPAKAEKAHNAKVDRAEAAARKQADSRAAHYGVNPYGPVVEERPQSLDSVDLDVQAYLSAPRLSQKIRHPQTGRIISFSEVGDPNGYAIFVCVGMGLTRFVMAFYDQLAATLKLRLITPERPGIGGSQVDPNGTPLTWPDDVSIICQALRITKFSLLAHSAGAIYALATSLRMPQHIRGRVHLLAPWIPPSQMAPIGIGKDSPPTQQLPRSQRFLRALPPSLLRVANSTFLSNTSASLQRTGPTKAPKSRRKSSAAPAVMRSETPPPPLPLSKESRRESMLMMDQVLPNASSLTLTMTNTHDPVAEKARLAALSLAERERQRAFDERLTFAIWDRATAGANPATDLIVCLETKHSIGFRYEDINRPVVIHHGSKDSRVPVDNVRWLGKLMRKCEVRVLEGEQHGLMASAQVMGNVLTEMAADWEDWTAVVKQASVSDLRSLARRKASFA